MKKQRVMRMEQTKTNPFIEFLKNPISIIIYLIILVLVLLGCNYYLARSTSVYVFSGYSDQFTFMDGSIYIGNDINNFTSPNIIYSGEEILLSDYKVGYYIEDGKDYKVISVKEKEDEDEETVKLSELIESTEFSFTEYHKGAQFFSKENIKNLEDLCFLVEGSDIEGEKISFKVELETVKVSK